MSRFLFALLLSLAAPAVAVAGVPTVYGGVSQSKLELRGSAGGDGGRYGAKLHSGLGYDQATARAVYIGVETGLPIVPNVRVSHVRYAESAQHSFAAPGGNLPMPGPGLATRSRLGIDSSDVALFYTPVKIPFRLDIGLDLHRLQVDFALDARRGEQSLHAIHKRATQWFPALYLASRFDLPVTDLYIAGRVYASRYGDRELLQARVGLGWTPLPLLGVELGYTRQRLKFSSDAIAIDMHADGPYLGLALRF